MRTTIIQIGALCAILVCSAAPLWAEPCADARKMVDETIAVPPKAGTDEMLQTALKQCPGKPEVYHLIGDYYNNWWKQDINPEKQATYNYLATEYYAKGIKLGKGKEIEAMRRKLAALESSTEDITEVGIRSIKPGARRNIRVFFEFNSSALSKEAQDELDVLGRYLGDDVKSSRIVLEGHTDMVGGEQYNMLLEHLLLAHPEDRAGADDGHRREGLLISMSSRSLTVRSFRSRIFLIDSPGTVAMSFVGWETSA